MPRNGPLTRELLLAPSRFGLGLLPERTQPEAVTRTICGYCSTGCSLDVHLRDSQAIGLTPTVEYPVNLGMACPKGWEALSVLDAADRATTPLVRNDTGRLQPATWKQALATFTGRMKAIQRQHGPHSIAFLGTGQLPTEELAFLGALAKFGLGMLHGDGNTRQCMATAVVAYQESFGFDAPPYTYADFEESDVLVFVGSNPCLAHPIMWERVMRNRHQPRIVVIDPRATETALAATHHLACFPKSDQSLLYGIARLLIERDWIAADYIAAHTNSFEAFAEFVQEYTLERVARDTGLAPADIESLARTIHEGKRVSFWWTMGVNQSHQGVRTAQAIINLALMTGNIGRPGTGANSITGQCNAMGSRLFSNTTNLLGGHQFHNPEHRHKVAQILGLDERVIPQEKSLPYHQIIEGILRGQIRGLWVVCTNPAHSWINQSMLHDVLDRLDFLVVQDMYHTTETARIADLVLPAAGWGEKEGTFINSERRIGVIKKVARAPGEALADFSIFRLIAEAWGCGDMFRHWTSPAAVFQILKQLSAGQPCDITGIADYEQLDATGGIQWPCAFTPAQPMNLGRPTGVRQASQGSLSYGSVAAQPSKNPCDATPSERRLFADGRFFHADGKARFCFEPPRPIPEQPTTDYPLLLLTGRGSASQWHTQTRTGKSPVLAKLYSQNVYVEINPTDATALAIKSGQIVRVSTQRGSLNAKAVVTLTIQPGQIFLPMHYDVTNLLTDAVFDPYSSQPAYKACAARIERARTAAEGR